MAAIAHDGREKGAGLLDLEQARALVLNAVRPLAGEEVALEDSLGRVLAESASAETQVPAFDSSAMDGFAVRSEDLARAGEQAPVALEIVGESRAGTPAAEQLGAGQAIAISTGAVIPEGADGVVRVEDTSKSAPTRVEVFVPVAPEQNVRRAGEDLRAGELVLERGALIGPAELGVLASLGRVAVRCTRRPRVSVLVSGDELLAAGEEARPGAVRDTNSLTIAALTARAGGEVVRVASVGDDPEATTAAIGAALQDVDVAVICGGVSVGEHDHVRSSLSELGALEELWGIALKPGRPTWFGTLGQTLIFGLPGNPVSAMVTFALLVRPALRALLGLGEDPPRLSAVMDSAYEKPPGRAHAVRCSVSAGEDGWHVRPTGAQGSHVLSSMLGADALAIIGADVEVVQAGERVEIEPLRMWVEGLA
ncbi:MAG: molybdopterin molybdotransferase MoeA [Solirubrobacterales bacterium]|nr:molybdopterin molybdotransferase MoeA [Solirubrobacterales bacterium]